ncbi:divergent polysaccharide deacetylase family protein [Marinobacter bryozoorum]|uniref:divergent polysaccharide deacetylase family protein n=1 Tax=Marinobacter bryozoorum TaxID=256324 RepID=UPI0020068B50|nr:divergent polysaccharide deacetylase family protein [Marinobacter bryozoorum]MCK7544257.1 divergent polysaccharide deacetylase family protein [Marinobacter bryozoorum]
MEAPPAVEGLQPTIAIIIDDMGANAYEGRRLIDMDQPLTLAFLPYRRHTTELATLAHRNHKEVMLHAPMDNTRSIGLGAGGLTVDMDKATLTQTLRQALHAIPHVQGVNNHMGSLLTQLSEPMSWVMEELHHYPLYFVDSRTIATTVAGRVAAEGNIPSLTRDVFLDHEQTEAFVHQQFQQLIRKARENGTAIAIGHPHTVTVDYLEKALPELDEQGISVATVSGIWAIRNGNRRMFAEGEKREIVTSVARSRGD